MENVALTINNYNNSIVVYLIVAVVFFIFGMFRSSLFPKHSLKKYDNNNPTSQGKEDTTSLHLGRIVEGAISATLGTVLATIIINNCPLSKPPTPAPSPSSTPSKYTEWSDWTTNVVESSLTRQVEQRQSRYVTYNMVHYGTQQDTEPYYRMFRDYSINENFHEYHARDTYGEKHLIRTASASQMEQATSYPPNGDYITIAFGGETYEGLQLGNSTAYNFGDDKYLWYIESKAATTVTEYRYRDALQSEPEGSIQP